MSQITKVTYRARRYMVTWHSVKKTPMSIEVWRAGSQSVVGRALGHYAGMSPAWCTIWAIPKPMGPTARAVAALAEKAAA